jgi:hypothetical protein
MENTDEGLDSKAEIAIHEYKPGVFTVCVRGNYLENLKMYSFHRLINTFTEYRLAKAYVQKTYPRANLVSFIELTKGDSPSTFENPVAITL